MSDDELRAAICEAFDVTEEEIRVLDVAMGGPQRRAARAHFRDVVIPARLLAVTADINAMLPEGYGIAWDVTSDRLG